MIEEPGAVVTRICDDIAEFCDIAVIGMSGGADSTLVAALCAEALGPENVYTLHMPYDSLDASTFNTRSIRTAEMLGVCADVVNISGITNAINTAVRNAVNDELNVVNAGNARSRARMNVLYGFSHHLGEISGQRARVIGTGNLSEDFIGYDTKGGDALADIFPIGELLKSEVYQLLDFFKSEGRIDESCIDRVPSAGLWSGQTDEAELGHSYASMEPIVVEFFDALKMLELAADSEKSVYAKKVFELQTKTPLHEFVWNRHVDNMHKHEAPPAISLRDLCS